MAHLSRGEAEALRRAQGRPFFRTWSTMISGPVMIQTLSERDHARTATLMGATDERPMRARSAPTSTAST
jgi:nucleoside diphosphate kinase